MATDNNHLDPNLNPKPHDLHHLWARVGVSLYVSDETYEKLIRGDNNALKEVLLGKNGRAELDGETYFPESLDNENENNRLKNEFDIRPTPLHETAEKAIQRDSHSNAAELLSFYYTFGTSDKQPFQKGWIEVKALSRQHADQLFRSAYPDQAPGILNCSSVLDQTHFAEYLNVLSDHPDWQICHGTIQGASNTPEGKVYVFCEEHEDGNGIREFTIHGVSTNQDELQKLLAAKVKKDEYGLIADNGLEENDPNYVETDFVDERGFVRYYLHEADLLDQAKIQDMLKTPAYDTAFSYPSNLPELLDAVLSDIAESLGHHTVDTTTAVSSIMDDPKFQAMIKTSWWGDDEIIDGKTTEIAKRYIRNHITDRLEDASSFFIRIGAIPKDTFPANLKDLVVSSIYDVSRDHHLPVVNADGLAQQIISSDKFIMGIQENYRGYAYLKEGSEVYDQAEKKCYSFVQNQLVYSKEHKRRISDLLSEANMKKEQPPAPEKKTPPHFSKE